MKSVAIVGFGRFGELMAGLCGGVFEVNIVVRNEVKAAKAREQGYTVLPLEQIGSSGRTL